QGAARFLLLRLENGDVGKGLVDPGRGTLHGGNGLVVIGLRLLERLAAVDLAGRKLLLALQLELGARRAGVGRDEERLRLIDRGLLCSDLPPKPGDRGVLDCDLILCGLDRETIVAVVDAQAVL